MKKIMLLAGLALVLAGSIVYANQSSPQVQDGGPCSATSCPTGGGCCTK